MFLIYNNISIQQIIILLVKIFTRWILMIDKGSYKKLSNYIKFFRIIVLIAVISSFITTIMWKYAYPMHTYSIADYFIFSILLFSIFFIFSYLAFYKKCNHLYKIYCNTNKFKNTEIELRKAISLLKSVIECSDEGICAVQGLKKDKRLIIYNKKYPEILNIPFDHKTKYNYDEGFKLTYGKVKNKNSFLNRVNYLYKHPEEEGHDTYELVDGRFIDRLSIPYKHDSKIIGRIWVYRDISSRVKMERDLKNSEEKFKNIFLKSPIGIQLYSSNGDLLESNEAAITMLKNTNLSSIDKIVLSMDDKLKHMLKKGEVVHFEKKLYVSNNAYIGKATEDNSKYFDILITPIIENSNYLVQIQDITELKNNQKTIEQIAYYDSLTGLPNRKLFMDCIEKAFYHAKKNNNMFAVFFIDLDKFKSVNDTYGHAIGDALLIETAKKLKCSVRKDAVAARLGGDEFTILIPYLKNKKVLKKIAEKILSHFSRPINIDGTHLFITPSIGISIFPENGISIEDIMKNADEAMYKAKSNSGFCYEFCDLKYPN